MANRGIPDPLFIPLRNTLVETGAFDTNSKIRAVCANTLLTPWRNSLPEAETVLDRVEGIMAYLADKKHRATGINALVLLLQVLRDRADPEDAIKDRLADLANELQHLLTSQPFQQGVLEEANPGNQTMILAADWIYLLNCMKAVGKFTVPKIVRGQVTEQIASGTGWLIASDLLLTCWHNIRVRDSYERRISETDLMAQVTNSLVTFDFTLPGKGTSYKVTVLECYDQQLDYALLRLQTRKDAPLEGYGALKIDLDMPLTLQAQLYIIQHPKGQLQQLSAGKFIRNKEGAPRILHTAPSEPGTSGAPVLNTTNWKVAALHTGEDLEQGLREATLLRDCMNHLQQKRPDLYQQITAIQ